MSSSLLPENANDVGLPVVRINQGNTPRGCLFDAWRESTRPLFDVIAVNSFANYRADITSYRVAEPIVSHTRYDATIYMRTSKQVIHGDTDHFALHFLRSGAERIVTEHGVFRMAPDRICLHDWRYSFVGTAERTDQIGVVIPRHLVQVHDNVSATSVKFLSTEKTARCRCFQRLSLDVYEYVPVIRRKVPNLPPSAATK